MAGNAMLAAYDKVDRWSEALQAALEPSRRRCSKFIRVVLVKRKPKGKPQKFLKAECVFSSTKG